jgi:hypothetical protein
LPYFLVFGVDKAEAARLLSSTEVEVLDKSVFRATGLVLLDRDLRQKRLWIGRVGYRVELATGLRQLFEAAGQTSNNESEIFLSRLIACGELHNVIASRSLLVEGAPLPSAANSERAQRALPVLHIEAARFLLEDRLTLAPRSVDVAGLLPAWRALVDSLMSDHPPTLSGSEAVRSWAAILRVKERYKQSGLEIGDMTQEDELQRVVDDPFLDPLATTRGAWTAFLNEIREFLLMLANREPDTAEVLLRAKLAQDWHELPKITQTALQACVASLPQLCLRHLSRARAPQALLVAAMQLCERPALVAGALAVMAAEDARRRSALAQDNQYDLAIELSKIADGLLRLRASVGKIAAPATIPTWSQYPALSSLRAATTVLTDEHYMQQLCRAFAEGAKTGTKLSKETGTVIVEIQGVALGVHGKLDRMCRMAKDVDEAVLTSARAAGFY